MAQAQDIPTQRCEATHGTYVVAVIAKIVGPPVVVLRHVVSGGIGNDEQASNSVLEAQAAITVPGRGEHVERDPVRLNRVALADGAIDGDGQFVRTRLLALCGDQVELERDLALGG